MIPADELAGTRDQTLVDPATQQVTIVVAVTLRRRPEVDGTEVLEARWFAADRHSRPRWCAGRTSRSRLIGAVGPRPPGVTRRSPVWCSPPGAAPGSSR